jgi:hypothetical protein
LPGAGCWIEIDEGRHMNLTHFIGGEAVDGDTQTKTAYLGD